MGQEEIKETMAKEVAPRGFVISKEDLETHGFSKASPGCIALLKGHKATHAPACRERLSLLMSGEEKVMRAAQKMNEYLARVVEKDAKAREAKPKEKKAEEDKEAAGKGKQERGKIKMNMRGRGWMWVCGWEAGGDTARRSRRQGYNGIHR